MQTLLSLYVMAEVFSFKKLVLIHDRTDISPQVLEILKNELLEVISRHIEIDPESVLIAMTQDGREQRLIADIPLKTAHRRKIG